MELGKVKAASRQLVEFDERFRNQVLQGIAESLAVHSNQILSANKKDMSAVTDLPPAFVSRMHLNEEKMQRICDYPRQIARMDEVVGSLMEARELDKDLLLRKIRVPLGVLLFIFESRPDAYIQMLCLAWKTANALIWKGGSETMHTTSALHNAVQNLTRDMGIPDSWNLPLQSRLEVRELLKSEGSIDLVIPRGSSELVRHIMQESRIPVLGHAEGICHIYVDADVDREMAKNIILDAKTENPGVCNAVDTLLVHVAQEGFIASLSSALKEAGVRIMGEERLIRLLPSAELVTDWRQEYLDLILAIRIVDSLEEAIDHINSNSSSHTDAIITKNATARQQFIQQVDSADVMVNCSTRFSDGARYGLGAETGISTGKLHARGPVGLDGLLTYKWVLEGSGQVVRDYMGPQARAFTHRNVTP